ncbi:MAG: TRAP transporter small permease subunit [Deltaproteobacteria bacterium]|nr:TRAP transporter small permease subunit [Deltaproteobacteria bacterium]
MRRLLNIFDSISEWTGRISVWAVCFVTAIIVYEVITRRLFHSPHVWTYEIITLFYGFHFMILAGYTLLYHGHVSIDLVYNRLSPKKRAILDIVTYLVFFFPFLIFLFKAGLSIATASWATHEKTLTARLPLVLPLMKTVIPATALLLLLQGFSNFYRRLFFLIKGGEF